MVDTAARPHPSNQWRIAICALLLLFVAGGYLLVLAGTPVYYARVAQEQAPLGTTGLSEMSNEVLAARAAARGLSMPAYAAYTLAFQLVNAAGFLVAGTLVLWKAGGDWFRWLTALVLIFIPLGLFWDIVLVSEIGSDYLLASSLLWPTYLVFLFLFPNGRAVPRWARWPVAAFAGLHFAFQAVPILAELGWVRVDPAALEDAFGLTIQSNFVFVALCQLYRYFRVAAPAERKQIRWFVFGLLAVIVISTLLAALAGQFAMEGDHGYLSDLDSLSLLIIPAAITISILRYRLWDIDVLIRRTLIYSLLTALLALAYFGSVLVLQAVLRPLGLAGRSELATVLSTLAIAALFAPLRARVQSLIDRRLYRRRYDASRTLAAFSASARDDVALDSIAGHLLTAVNDSVQPTHAGLWLKSGHTLRPGGQGKADLPEHRPA